MTSDHDARQAAALEAARDRTGEFLAGATFVDHAEVRRQPHGFAVWDATAQ